MAAIIERPDHMFATMMEISVVAARNGEQQPWPWFLDLCRGLLDA
jgi:hypothetical protein